MSYQLNAASRLRAAFAPPPPVAAELMAEIGMKPTGDGFVAYNARQGAQCHRLIQGLNAQAVKKEKYPMAPLADEHKCYTLVFADGTKIKVNEIYSPYGFGRVAWSK